MFIGESDVTSMLSLNIPSEGAYAGQAESPQGDIHGDPHVRSPAAGVSALVHP